MHALAAFAIRCPCRLAGFAVAAMATTVACAQPPAAEESVEAAYLHKFPGFVDWPADAFKTANSPIVIGVVGAPKVFDDLTQLARGRLVLGRPVEARQVNADSLPSDMHVLFIGKSAAGDAGRLIDDACRAHMLIVTDISDGLKAGAVLDFVEIDGRLRFEASLPAAHRADIRLSSKLLSVAAKVVEETP
jgi:hypothetical protein